MRNKYGNRKTSVDGMDFDSKKEAARYWELKLLERAGVIRELRRQVKYILVPTQRDQNGKVIEHACGYVADFVYKVPVKGPAGAVVWEDVVEDTKGCRTDVYIIKRKLMLERYGIRIREV